MSGDSPLWSKPEHRLPHIPGFSTHSPDHKTSTPHEFTFTHVVPITTDSGHGGASGTTKLNIEGNKVAVKAVNMGRNRGEPNAARQEGFNGHGESTGFVDCVLVHEWLHALGAQYHHNGLDCQNKNGVFDQQARAPSAPPPLLHANYTCLQVDRTSWPLHPRRTQACASVEYGDMFSAVGSGGNYACNVPGILRAAMGWLSKEQVVQIRDTRSAVTLSPLETANLGVVEGAHPVVALAVMEGVSLEWRTQNDIPTEVKSVEDNPGFVMHGTLMDHDLGPTACDVGGHAAPQSGPPAPWNRRGPACLTKPLRGPCLAVYSIKPVVRPGRRYDYIAEREAVSLKPGRTYISQGGYSSDPSLIIQASAAVHCHRAQLHAHCTLSPPPHPTHYQTRRPAHAEVSAPALYRLGAAPSADRPAQSTSPSRPSEASTSASQASRPSAPATSPPLARP